MSCPTSPELLDVRVAQLETGIQPKLATLSVTRATVSLVGAAVFAVMFLAAVFSFGGPACVVSGYGHGAYDGRSTQRRER